MSYLDTLSSIDDYSIEVSSERDISNLLKKFTPENNEPIDQLLLSEIIAFEFIENYQSKESGWNTYFRPMIEIRNNDGTGMESPSINLVTPEMIEYWTKRATETKNPLLIARYSGLVWNFQLKITGKKPDHTICKKYIEALLNVVKKGDEKVSVYSYHKLERALALSVSINDKPLIEQSKNALIEFEKNNSVDSKAGTWGYCFDLLIGNTKVNLSTEEESQIILELENQLTRLTEPTNNETKIATWSAERAAIKLAEYYRRKNKSDELKRVLLKLGDSFKSHLNDTSAMQAASSTEHLYRIFKKFNLQDEAESLLISFRELGPKVSEEMQTISHKMDIPREQLDKYIDSMVEGDVHVFLDRFVATYIPKKETAKEQIFQLSKNSPMMFLFTTVIQDGKGRPIAKIGSLENDLEGHIVKSISQTLEFSSLFIRLIIEKAQEKLSFSKKEVLDYIKTPILTENRIPIIEKALDAYFSKDYIVFIHLVIPQIEEAIRGIIEMAGGNVLKEARSGGYHLRTFDDILRDEIIIDSLGEDFAAYFRIVFTDARGWNTRNNVCHGLSNPKTFDYKVADRLLHSLLCLGLIQIKKQATINSSMRQPVS